MRHDGAVSIPSLPEPEGIRAIAILGSVAMLCWLAASVAVALRRRDRELAWSVSLVALSALTAVLGRGRPGWHVVLAGITCAVGLRNAVLQRGAARWLTIAGLVAWIATVVRARMLFG